MIMKKWLTSLLLLSAILLTLLFQNSYAGRLHIETIPDNATIRLMNIKPKFQQGMNLMKGNYDVSIIKTGYQPYRNWINVGDNDKKLTIELTPLQRYPLTINTTPADAKIYIMNIEPKFQQGMLLLPGEYDVLVKKMGYPPKREWIEITDKAMTINVVLGQTGKFEIVEKVENPVSIPLSQPQPTIEPEITTPSQYHLYVKTTPSDAEIQFLNVQKTFQQGMLLPAGHYYLRITRQGYPTRRQWVKIKNEDVTLTVGLSSLPICFFSEESKDEMAILRSVKLKFYEDFVDASYYVQNMPFGLTNYSQFRGVKQDTQLHLIGLMEYEGQQEELKVQMQLQNNRLTFNIDGSQHVLMQTNCQDTPTQ